MTHAQLLANSAFERGRDSTSGVLVRMNVTQRELAEAIRVPYQRVNEFVNERRGITPGTAL